MNEQGQYKEAVRTLNKEVKEVKGKLEEADRQKQKLLEEVMTLREKVETVRTDAVQKFKTSQLFIDSYAFPELDLLKIIMDAPKPTTPVRNVITDDDDGSPKSQLPPKDDGSVVLAQPAVNPSPTPISKIPMVAVDIDNPQPQKDDGNLADAPNA